MSFNLLILQRVDRVEDETRSLRSELHKETGQIRQEIGQMYRELRQEMALMRQDIGGLARWSFGTVAVVVVSAIGVITALLHHP